MPIKTNQDRTERAEAAVKAFRALQPGLSGFARAITGKKNVRVEIATGGPRTDGEKIFFRPPIELGDKTPHQRMLCDKRDEAGLQKCPACRTREKVLASILHEISHIAFGTFEKPSTKTLNESMDRALEQVSSKFAKLVRDNWKNIPDEHKQDHMNLSKFISPFLPLMLNCLEDVRVETAMFKARPGTRVMFDALSQEAFRDGITLDDGTVSMWRDQPLNSQATIGLYVLGCGFDYKGWFHPDIEAALGDARLRELVGKVDTLRSAEGTYNLAFPILARLRELGFLRSPEDPDDDQETPEEPEPEETPEEEESDDAGDDEEAGQSEDEGDQSEGDPSPDGSDDRDADPEAGDPGDDGQADGDTGASEGGEGDADGDAPDVERDGGDPGPGEGEAGAGSADGDDAEGSESPADVDEDAAAAGEGSGEEGQAGAPGESDSDGDDSDGVGSPGGGERGDDDGGADPVQPGDSGESSNQEGGEGSGRSDLPSESPSEPESGDRGDGSAPGHESGADGSPEGGSSDGEGSDDSASDGLGVQPEGAEAGAEGDDSGDLGTESTGSEHPEASGDDASESQSDDNEPIPGEALGDDAGAGSGVVAEPDPTGDEGSSDRQGEGSPEPGRGADSDGEEDTDAGLHDEFGDAADGAEGGPGEPVDGPGEAAEEATDQGHSTGVEESDDEEIIDTLPDEGKGGQKTLSDDSGSPEDVARDLLVFGRHDTMVDPQPPTPEEEADAAEVDRAIIQGLYFETPSMHVSGVRIHKFGDSSDTEADAWINEDDEYIRRNRKKLGLDRSIEVGEDILGPALIQMRKTFADNKRADMQRHLKSGKVNARSLGKRAWAGDPRLFQKKRIPGKRDYAVVIGIDISGSTAGMNLMLAKRAARTQAELCHRMGIDFAVYAHSANGWWEEFTMDIYEVKAFDKAWDATAQRALTNLTDDAGNLDGHTIEFYRKMVEKHPATDKIVLYYTDGKMPAANHDEELEILLREIRYCKSKGINLMGVGIRTDSPTKYGLDTVQVDDDSDMVKVVRHLETALLRRR